MPGRGCSKDRHRRAERTVLKNCRKITETLGQDRDMSSEEKRKKNWDGESALSTRRNGQCCGKTFSNGGSFRYHIEKDHLKSPRFHLGE